MRLLLVVIVSLYCSVASPGAVAAFEDVTQTAGFAHVGESYGASWGDFDGDGAPDLWVSNHADAPNLFRNNQDGTFTDIAPQVWPGRFLPADTICYSDTPGVCLSDTHGAAWADFDNDGDEDLLEVVGGERGNHLFVNDGVELIERAQEFGLHAMGARSRTAGWFDWNRDGRLDAVLTHEPNTTSQSLLLTQQSDYFTSASFTTGIGSPRSNSIHLADISEDFIPEFIISTGGRNSGPLFKTLSTPFQNLVYSLDIPGAANTVGCSDSVYADFDGDLRTDIFSVCASSPAELVQRNDFKIEAMMSVVADERAVEFNSEGSVTLSVFPNFDFDPELHLRVGANGQSPEVTSHPEQGWRSFSVTLDPANPEVQGTPPHGPGQDLGLFVGFDPASNLWRFALSSSNSKTLALVMIGTTVITNVVADGFSATPAGQIPIYLHRVDGGFVDATAVGGFTDQMRCPSAVGADFDNDSDIDLFLVCTRSISNIPDKLFLNNGNGSFVEAVDAAGAAGSDLGSGDSVAVADFDQDGFLDLFVTNGSGNAPFYNGPHKLFRNLGNANHWLEIDLIGSPSSRSAIGAHVTVSAGGVTQMRMQDGGFHRRSQNHKRLHFGLAQSTVIDSLIVRWPSGNVSTLQDIAVDQILVLSEAELTDDDGDGVSNAADNCTLVANGQASGSLQNQCDTNGDGYGNVCDPDLNNNGVVNVVDLGILKAAIYSSPGDANWNPDADLSCDGSVVNLVDLGLMKSYFLAAPGPSAVAP